MNRAAEWERTDGIVWRVEAQFGTQGFQNEGDSKDTVYTDKVEWLFARKPLKVVVLSFLLALVACSHCPCCNSVRSQAATGSAEWEN